MKIGKTYRFEAAHHLPNYDGKCRNPHGHSYRLEVEVEGDIIPVGSSDGGMVMDFADLDEMMEKLLSVLDHHDLNISTRSFLQVQTPTAELLVRGIANWMHKQPFPAGVHLSRVRLYETEKAYAEWSA